MRRWLGCRAGWAAAREQAQKLPTLAAMSPRLLLTWHCSEVSVAELSHSPDGSGHSLSLLHPGLYTRDLRRCPDPRPRFVTKGRSLFSLHYGCLLGKARGGLALSFLSALWCKSLHL